MRARWFKLLEDLSSYGSNVGTMDGNKAIVTSLVSNLESAKPLPVHFKAHDSRTTATSRRVLIERPSRPIFYLEQDFLTVSLPMKPRPHKKGRPKRRKG